MRAAVFLLIAGAFYYAGGFYDVPALVALALAMAVVWALSFALARWSLAHVQVHLVAQPDETARGGEAKALLEVANASAFPCASCRVSVSVAGTGAGDRHDGRRARPGVKVLGTAAGRHVMRVPVLADAPHCGTVSFCADELRVRDPLGLFKPRRALEGSALVAVLPRGADPVPIEPARAAGPGPLALGGSSTADRPGTEPPDVQDTRPWRAGDPLSAVHWKLTARTGELQTKRFSDDEHADLVLLLDPAVRGRGEDGGAGDPRAAGEQAGETGVREASPETAGPAARLDAWYEASANLAQGLARAGVRFVAVWPAQSGEAGTDRGSLARRRGPVLERTVGDGTDVRALLHDLALTLDAGTPLDRTTLTDGQTALVLDGDLSLTCGRTVLARFDADGRLVPGGPAVILAAALASPPREASRG